MKNLPPELQTYIKEVGAAYGTIEKYINSLLDKIETLEFDLAMKTVPTGLAFNEYLHKHRYSDQLTEVHLAQIKEAFDLFSKGTYDTMTQQEFYLLLGSNYGLKPGQISAMHDKYKKETK